MEKSEDIALVGFDSGKEQLEALDFRRDRWSDSPESVLAWGMPRWSPRLGRSWRLEMRQ